MCYLYIKNLFYTSNVINDKFIIAHCAIISKSGEYLYDITDLIKQYNVNLDTPIYFYKNLLKEYIKNNKEHIIIVFNGDQQIEYEM